MFKTINNGIAAVNDEGVMVDTWTARVGFADSISVEIAGVKYIVWYETMMCMTPRGREIKGKYCSHYHLKSACEAGNKRNGIFRPLPEEIRQQIGHYITEAFSVIYKEPDSFLVIPD